MKTYKINDFCFTGEHTAGAHIILTETAMSGETTEIVHNFPTLQKAEAFSFFLEGLGYTREK